jgi:transcriptional antiterminator RfaH
VKRWYVVHCKPNEDERAETQLLNQGFEIFRPRVRAHRRCGGVKRVRITSMFPRYLFIHLEETGEQWASVKYTRGVIGLVRAGDWTPAVPDPIVEALLEQIDAEGCIDTRADGGLVRNDRVRVTEGPFEGLEALFEARNGTERAIVLLNMIRVNLPLQALERVSA